MHIEDVLRVIAAMSASNGEEVQVRCEQMKQTNVSRSKERKVIQMLCRAKHS